MFNIKVFSLNAPIHPDAAIKNMMAPSITSHHDGSTMGDCMILSRVSTPSKAPCERERDIFDCKDLQHSTVHIHAIVSIA